MSEMIVTEKGRAQPDKLTVWDAGTRIAVDVGTGYPAARPVLPARPVGMLFQPYTHESFSHREGRTQLHRTRSVYIRFYIQRQPHQGLG